MPRYFAAVDKGVCVGSRSTFKAPYTLVCLHKGGAAGTFATFHRTEESARFARFSFPDAPTKEIKPAVETHRLLRYGEPLRDSEVA